VEQEGFPFVDLWKMYILNNGLETILIPSVSCSRFRKKHFAVGYVSPPLFDNHSHLPLAPQLSQFQQEDLDSVVMTMQAKSRLVMDYSWTKIPHSGLLIIAILFPFLLVQTSHLLPLICLYSSLIFPFLIIYRLSILVEVLLHLLTYKGDLVLLYLVSEYSC
jgi:hypothetical protein